MLPDASAPTATHDQHTLIHEHLRLVERIARETLRRVPSHVRYDDLVSAGHLALVQAANSFDPNRGVDFEAFAIRRIRGGILDELRSTDPATRSVRRQAREIEDSRTRLRPHLGREATDQEIADDLGMSLARVQEVNDGVHRSVVLSLNWYDNDEQATNEMSLFDSTNLPEDQALRREQMRYLVAAIAELPERVRAVIEGHYFLGRSMAEMGEEYGVTDSRISQLKADGLELLAEAMEYIDSGWVDLSHRYARPNGSIARRRLAYFEAVQARFAGTPDEPTTMTA